MPDSHYCYARRLLSFSCGLLLGGQLLLVLSYVLRIAAVLPQSSIRLELPFFSSDSSRLAFLGDFGDWHDGADFDVLEVLNLAFRCVRRNTSKPLLRLRSSLENDEFLQVSLQPGHICAQALGASVAATMVHRHAYGPRYFRTKFHRLQLFKSEPSSRTDLEIVALGGRMDYGTQQTRRNNAELRCLFLSSKSPRLLPSCLVEPGFHVSLPPLVQMHMGQCVVLRYHSENCTGKRGGDSGGDSEKKPEERKKGRRGIRRKGKENRKQRQ